MLWFYELYQVIHVDYGTVDNIPKTELRFLKVEFCNLPCQAIHCCLTGYNELDSISPEVTNAFLKIINISKKVLVMVDDHFILVNCIHFFIIIKYQLNFVQNAWMMCVFDIVDQPKALIFKMGNSRVV